MGAWGEKAFENDAAQDWLAELGAGGLAMLRRTLATAANAGEEDELDVDEASAAIAAAEIVVAALGRGRDRVPERVVSWLDANAAAVGADDLTLARDAVERVFAGPSELRALWEESGSDTAWHAELRALLQRLAPVAETAAFTAPAARATAWVGRKPVGERDKQVLVTFLGARGLVPTPEQMERIRRSRDAAEIRRWLKRALDAPSVDAVLDG